jgi:hypothetical protein
MQHQLSSQIQLCQLKCRRYKICIMRQYAWLELDKGMWCLLTDIKNDPNESMRRWADKNAAIAELKDEGWTITGPYTKRCGGKQHPERRFHGYGLMRTIH